jgi:hypothetical protein
MAHEFNNLLTVITNSLGRTLRLDDALQACWQTSKMLPIGPPSSAIASLQPPPAMGK